MVHISLGRLVFIQSVQSLCLRQRRQCSHVTDLCLSSRKHCGAVYSRDQVNLCRKRSDLIDCAAVRTLVILEDHLSDCLLLILVNRFTENGEPFLVVCKRFFQLLCDHADILFSCLLVVGKYSFLHLLRRNDLFDRLEELFRNSEMLILVLRLAALCNDRIDECDDLLVQVVSGKDRLDHLVFRHLVGACLDHDDLLFRGSDCKSKVRCLSLL